MKGIKFDRKLVLNKKTVAHLTSDGMNNVFGGQLPTAYSYCLYTCTGLPCFGWDTDEFRGCEDLTNSPTCP